jgi:hypothetical protein
VTRRTESIRGVGVCFPAPSVPLIVKQRRQTGHRRRSDLGHKQTWLA